MKRYLAGVLLACLLLSVPVVTAQEAGHFEPARCPIPIPPDAVVDCGYLTVPERHEHPDGPGIELAVAILRASDANPRPDPVIYLEGGPGGSALYGLRGWVGEPITRQRDLILFDQRGTGYSIPALFCIDYEYNFRNYDNFVDYERACAEAMTDDGIDLGAYNSAQSAQDVVMLASALGLDEVNLYGISYGTRLAMTILRDAPHIVRSAVLDSPYPPHINGYEMQGINGYGAIEAMLAACAADKDCDTAFPDLRARFYLWVESGDTVGVDYGEGKENVDGYVVVDDVFNILYDSAAIPYLPLALDNLLAGDTRLFGALVTGEYFDASEAQERFERLYDLADDFAMLHLGYDDYDDFIGYFNTLTDAELVALYDEALIEAEYEDYVDAVALYLGMSYADADEYLDTLGDAEFNRLFDDLVNFVALGWYDVGDSDATFNSVTCVEEYPFNDIIRGELLAMEIPDTMRESLSAGLYDQAESCKVWGVEPAAALENEVVESDVPVLVLAGEFDPITPPSFAEAAVEGLSRAQMLIITGGGHSVIDAGMCPAQIGVAFLNAPDAPLDTSCADSLRVEWVMP